jgi:hypothetical protein
MQFGGRCMMGRDVPGIIVLAVAAILIIAGFVLVGYIIVLLPGINADPNSGLGIYVFMGR